MTETKWSRFEFVPVSCKRGLSELLEYRVSIKARVIFPTHANNSRRSTFARNVDILVIFLGRCMHPYQRNLLISLALTKLAQTVRYLTIIE
jgi:hypothetical protein